MEKSDSKGDAPESDDAPPPSKGADMDQPVPSLRAVPPVVVSKIEGRVRWACMVSLVALGLVTWALIQPKPLPVIVAMSVGQVIGASAFLLFLGSVALDIRARYRLTRRTLPPKPKTTAK